MHMDTIQKRFLLILSLYSIGNLIAITFTNFYIWQKTNDLHTVLVYNAMVFLAMGIGGFLSGLLAERKGSMFTYKLSMLLYAVQFFLLAGLNKSVLAFIPLIGTFSGLAIGMQAFSYNSVTQKITTLTNRGKFFGTKTSILNLVILLATPAIAILIQISSSYLLLFVAAILLFFIITLLLRNLHLFDITREFEWNQLYTALKQNADISSFFKAKFLYGIQDGLFWVVLGIITLKFIGNLGAWGLFSAFLTLLTIVIAYIYGQFTTPRTGNFISVLATFVFATVTIVLSANWNLSSFIVYQIVLVLLSVVMSVDFDSFLADILDQDNEIAHLRSEYNALAEVVTNLGRLVPVVTLLMLNVTELNNLYLRIAFLLVAPIPLFIMNILSGTNFLQTGGNKPE